MADVSKFIIDGTSYDLVDQTARTNYTTVSNKVTQLETKVNNRTITYRSSDKAIVVTTKAAG